MLFSPLTLRSTYLALKNLTRMYPTIRTVKDEQRIINRKIRDID